MVGTGKGSALSVRSGRPPEMPSGRSLCIFAAISRSPVAARPQRIIFSRYQVKTSLMSMPKTCPWMVGGGSGVSSSWDQLLPDGKALVPRTPRSNFFSTSFAQQRINLFSLIMRCQGPYLYKLGFFPHPRWLWKAAWSCLLIR